MDAKDDQVKTETFWEHLDELRSCIIRALVATVIFSAVAFSMKNLLFSIILAPHSSSFITYRLMGTAPFSIHLMNIGLTEQFMIHLRTAIYAGVLLVSPYILYLLFRFVSPALYSNERRYAGMIVVSAYIMFMLGTALNYFLIFPLTVRFLGTYQVSSEVANMLTLQSYIDTLLMMNIIMGIVFELPVVCWLLARMGLLTDKYMRRYRRHAIVVILIAAAVITPTTDAFTFFVVALPIWLLYEVSICIVRITQKKQ
jgi:sec-independent protein translocase protein TatC